MLEDVLQVQAYLCDLAQPRNDLGREKGVPAESEEVGSGTQARDSEHLAPYLGYNLLLGRKRRRCALCACRRQLLLLNQVGDGLHVRQLGSDLLNERGFRRSRRNGLRCCFLNFDCIRRCLRAPQHLSF